MASPAPAPLSIHASWGGGRAALLGRFDAAPLRRSGAATIVPATSTRGNYGHIPGAIEEPLAAKLGPDRADGHRPARDRRAVTTTRPARLNGQGMDALFSPRRLLA